MPEHTLLPRANPKFGIAPSTPSNFHSGKNKTEANGKFHELGQKVELQSATSTVYDLDWRAEKSKPMQLRHPKYCEWCRDWFHAKLPGGLDPDLSLLTALKNWTADYSRACRGGTWTDDASPFKCRYRGEDRQPDTTSYENPEHPNETRDRILKTLREGLMPPMASGENEPQ